MPNWLIGKIKKYVQTLTLATSLTHKFSHSATFKAGIKYKQLFYKYDLSTAQDYIPSTYAHIVNSAGSTNFTEAYSQVKYQLSPSLLANVGLRIHHFGLNKEVSLESRAGLAWKISDKHSLSFGYGKHSQPEDPNVYMIEVGGVAVNKDLKRAIAPPHLRRPNGKLPHQSPQKFKCILFSNEECAGCPYLLGKNLLSNRYFWITLLFPLISIIVAQLISLDLGHSLDQFYISGEPSFSSAPFNAWFVLCLAPVVEELAWHTYGTDALRSKWSLFTSSVIFTIYWGLWHLPLFFVKDYYQSNIHAEGLVYTLNFFVSLFAFVFIINWLYYKSGRNVLIAILFHLVANVSNEIFATHPDSKVIQSGLFAILMGYILVKERKLFFTFKAN